MISESKQESEDIMNMISEPKKEKQLKGRRGAKSRKKDNSNPEEQ